LDSNVLNPWKKPRFPIWPRYDAAFRAEALRLTSENHSALAAARAPSIDPKRLYAWQKAAQQPLPADPAGVRTLRAANKRLALELDILRKSHYQFLASPNPVSPPHFIDQQRVNYHV